MRCTATSAGSLAAARPDLRGQVRPNRGKIPPVLPFMRPGRAGQRYDRAVMRARALAARIALAAGTGLIAAPLVAIAGSSASQQSPAPGATSAPASKVADRAVGTRHRRLRARLRAIPAAVPAGSAVPNIAPPHAASSSNVSIVDFKFNPSSTTVHVGDTVVWTNQGSQQHTATATDGTFNTGTLNHGDVGRFTFTRAGTFNYTCKFHPFMKASVTVVGSSSNGSSSGGSSGSGSSGGSSTGSGSSGGGTGSSGSSSNPLPHTGLQVISLVIAGLALLGSGLVLRRGVRYPTEPPA